MVIQVTKSSFDPTQDGLGDLALWDDTVVWGATPHAAFLDPEFQLLIPRGITCRPRYIQALH
jgi:hypothetical protein